MYGIEYEDDILLLLRMIKFLHMQSPDAAHIFCQSHPVVDAPSKRTRIRSVCARSSERWQVEPATAVSIQKQNKTSKRK